MSDVPTLRLLADSLEANNVCKIYNDFQRLYLQKHYKEYVKHFENNELEKYFIPREDTFERYARMIIQYNKK